MPFRIIPRRQLKRAGLSHGSHHPARRVKTMTTVVVVLSLFTVLLAVALAAPADLDTTFDVDGKVTTDFNNTSDSASAVVIQPDGKIVTAGTTGNHPATDFALARYNTDGSPDLTFDTDGRVTTAIGTVYDVATALALQPDGKIVAAGYAYINVPGITAPNFALARYNADGSLDLTFDTDGKVTTQVIPIADEGCTASSVVIQPDGKIIVAGSVFGTGSNSDFALVRYNPDGSLDTSFDGDGIVTTDFNSRGDSVAAIVLQPDGKIVAAGSTALPGSDDDFALARYNPNGSLDLTFDSDGKVTSGFSNSQDGLADALIQPDGKIVVVGSSRPLSTSLEVPAMARYKTDGSLDASFGGDGIVTEINTRAMSAIALQPDGKIVAAGFESVNGNGTGFALARCNTDGTLDASFGTDGHVATAFGSTSIASAVALQPDGRIIAAGYARVGSANDFALARYTGDPRPNKTANFDADRRTDLSVWNPSSGDWTTLNTTDAVTNTRNWGSGALGDRPVPGDYDGDGLTDRAVFRPSEGNWYVLKSGDGSVLRRNWGGAGDIPVPGDYDLDGQTDAAIYRPSEGNWYILGSRANTVLLKQWGTGGDVPVPADYDGDGATDIAVFRPTDGNWYIITSRDRFARIVNWGMAGDRPVPADYDGDGRTDVAVFREGTWYIRHWTNAVTVKAWGDPTDVPVPADYDGDARADLAVWRGTESNWCIIDSSTQTIRVNYLGATGIPLPSAYIPQ